MLTQLFERAAFRSWERVPGPRMTYNSARLRALGLSECLCYRGALRVANRFRSGKQNAGFPKRLTRKVLVDHHVTPRIFGYGQLVQCSSCYMQLVLSCGNQDCAVSAQWRQAFDLFERERGDRLDSFPHAECHFGSEHRRCNCGLECGADVTSDLCGNIKPGCDAGGSQPTNDHIVALPLSLLGQCGPKGDKGCGERSHGDRTVHHNARRIDVHSHRSFRQAIRGFDWRDRALLSREVIALLCARGDVHRCDSNTSRHDDTEELLQGRLTNHIFPVAFFRGKIVARVGGRT